MPISFVPSNTPPDARPLALAALPLPGVPDSSSDELDPTAAAPEGATVSSATAPDNTPPVAIG